MRHFFSVQFLGVYVASLAVLLSQMPPLYEYFKRSKPEITTDGSLSFSHVLGRPRAYLPITISNDGSAALTVENVNCNLIHVQTGKTWSMQALTFVDQSSVKPFTAAREIPIGRPRVQPYNVWSKIVQCAVPPTPAQLQKIQTIGLSMTVFRYSAHTADPKIQGRVEIPEEIWGPAREEFIQTFDIVAGTYSIEISLVDAKSDITKTQTSEFEILENDISILVRHVDEFKYGGGIVVPVNAALSINKVIQ
jgi:hypothetical protein